MKLRILFFILAFIGNISLRYCQTTYPKGSGCESYFKLTDPGHKTAPTFTDKTYNAVYEYTNQSKSIAVYSDPSLFEENFDGGDKIYSFKQFNSGQNVTYIEIDSTQQIYIFNEQDGEMVCTVKPASDNDFSYMPKLPRVDLHGHHSYYLQQLLTIDAKYSQGFYGKISNDERGLEADRWDYCLENKMVGVSVYWRTTDTYGTDSKQVPLWIEIRYPHAVEFETINIFYFKANEISKSSLQTPTGVYCPGRKSIGNKTLPFIPNALAAFRFRGETIDTEGKDISWSNHWYDFSYNIRRVDYPKLTFPLARVSDILLYNIGYGFQLNRNTGECTVKKISMMQNEGVIFKYIKTSDFTDPKLLFGTVHQQYTYIGMRKIRGIDCEVYQTLRKGLPIGFENSTSVSELYIEPHGNQGYPIPIAMRLTPYNHTSKLFVPGDSFIYYFYEWHNYGMTESDLDAYDVAECFPDSHKEELEIKLDLKVTKSNFKLAVDLINSPNFLFKIREKAALLSSDMSLLQISNVRSYIDTDTNSIYALFTLLGRHPSIKDYTVNIPDITEAMVSLEREINANNLYINILFDHTNTKISAVPHSLNSVLGYSMPPVPSTTTTKSTTPPTTTTKSTTPPTTTTKSTTPTTTTTTRKTTVKPTTRRSRWDQTTPKKTTWYHHTTKSTTTLSVKSTPHRVPSTPKAIQKTTNTPPSGHTESTVSPTAFESKETEKEKLFTPGVLGGAGVGSLLGGLVIGAIFTFVQIKFMNGKCFGIQII